jgi:hypothetical protein
MGSICKRQAGMRCGHDGNGERVKRREERRKARKKWEGRRKGGRGVEIEE